MKQSDFTPLPAFDRAYLVALFEEDTANYVTTFGELFDAINGIERIGSKNADYTYTFLEDAILLSVDFRKISGNPTVKIGTVLGGDELSFSQVVTGDSINGFNLPFLVGDKIYIGISGGYVKVNIRKLNNYFL